MKPFRLVPAFLLKLILLASFLLNLPCVSRAQLVTTATYTVAYMAPAVNENQKVVAVGTDGYTRFLISESKDTGYGYLLTYVRCLDLDCETYNTHTWDLNGEDYGFDVGAFSLAIGPDGYARVAYQLGYETLGLIQCSDDNCDSSTNNMSIDSIGYQEIVSVAVGTDGTAYIVYDAWDTYDDDMRAIKMATCNSGSCSTSTIAAEISGRDAIWATVAIGSDGNPVIVYTDTQFSSDGSYLSSSGHYYKNGTDTIVSSSASIPDLSIGPDGFARIYLQNGDWGHPGATPGASFVKCTNLFCSSFTVNPISPSGVTPYGFGSLGVAADGNGRVEVDLGDYPDSDYYVECTAADCSTYDSSLISGSVNTSGIASLVADQNGIPKMIFQDDGDAYGDNAVVYQVRATCAL